MSIRVVKPGMSTTVQDLGRYGYAHLGISPAGAADALSLRIGNLVVGNNEGAAALEMTLLGATLEFQERAVIAICGAGCEGKIGDVRAPCYEPIEVATGTVLRCGSIARGARTYLAVRGGFYVPVVMGSRSTDIRGGFGGFQGRRLQASDSLSVGSNSERPATRLRAGALEQLREAGPIRVTAGAQRDWFTPASYSQFLSSTYIVSEQSDRAGLRLKGEAVPLAESKQLLTDGIPLGAIQVPQDGQPIILFVDQQTTGGYPKIVNVISADMHRVGQLRPRDEVRFAETSIPDAIEALRAQEQWLQSIFTE